MVTGWQQAISNSTFFTLDNRTLDSHAYVYDVMDLVIKESILRNNTVDSVINTKYTLFGQTQCHFVNASEPYDTTYYDTLGYPWYSTVGGVATVFFHNLIGLPVYSADSPEVHAFANLTYYSLPEVLSWAPEKAECTRKMRDLQGQLRTLALPAGQIDTRKNIQTIPLNIAVGKSFKPFGNISITWPRVQETTLTQAFTIKVTGEPDNRAIPLTIVHDGERSGVNVTDLNSDYYTYTIHYSYIAAGGKVVDAALSTDSIYLITANNNNSQHTIPYYADLGIVAFAGKTQGLTAVEIWQNNLRLGAKTVVNNQANIADYPSGVYQFSPIIDHNPQPLSQAITVFTPLPPKNNAPALTYCIKATFHLEKLDTHGGVQWSLPKEFAKNAVFLRCNYIDLQDNRQVEEWTLPWNAAITEYTDAKGRILKSNMTFTHAVKRIYASSLFIVIKNEKEAILVPLYQEAITLTPFDPPPLNEIYDYAYPAVNIAYITPVLELAARPKIVYLNTNLDTHAVKTELTPLAFTTQGFTLDIRDFPIGNYPLWIGDNKQTLAISDGSLNFQAAIADNPDDIKNIISPLTHFEHDRWSNETRQTNALAHSTDMTYNDENHCISKELPAVNVMTSEGDAIANFRLKTHFAYNYRNQSIGEYWHLQNNLYRAQAWIWDAVHPIIHVMPDGTKIKTQLWNTLDQIYQEKDARGFLGISQLIFYPARGRILTSHLGKLSDRLILDWYCSISFLVREMPLSYVLSSKLTEALIPFQVIVDAHFRALSIEFRSSPFQCLSRLPQHRSTGLYLL
jgi:hypothetical protein